MPGSPLGFMDALGNIARALIDSSRRVVIAGDPTAPGVPIVVTPNPLPVTTQSPVVVQSTNADKLIGYESGVAQQTVTAASAGNNTVSGAAVGAGKLWVIDSVSFRDSTSATTRTRLNILSGGNTFFLTEVGAVALGLQVVAPGGPWTLSPGEQISCLVSGCTAADQLVLDVHGYQCDST